MSSTLPPAPIVRFRWTAPSAFANLLSPLVFLFEGVRDAFDPGKASG